MCQFWIEEPGFRLSVTKLTHELQAAVIRETSGPEYEALDIAENFYLQYCLLRIVCRLKPRNYHFNN